MIMDTTQGLQAVQAAVASIKGNVHAIHEPFIDAIELATAEQDEQALTHIINALKCEECPWLFEQGKVFALTCIDGAVWESNRIKVAHDADELELNECADIRGDSKWWIKIEAPKDAKPQSCFGKLSAFCKFLDRASKRGGPELVAGETRTDAAKGAQAMALIASGAVTFDDIIAMAELPVAVESTEQPAASLKLAS